MITLGTVGSVYQPLGGSTALYQNPIDSLAPVIADIKSKISAIYSAYMVAETTIAVVPGVPVTPVFTSEKLGLVLDSLDQISPPIRKTFDQNTGAGGENEEDAYNIPFNVQLIRSANSSYAQLAPSDPNHFSVDSAYRHLIDLPADFQTMEDDIKVLLDIVTKTVPERETEIANQSWTTPDLTAVHSSVFDAIVSRTGSFISQFTAKKGGAYQHRRDAMNFLKSVSAVNILKSGVGPSIENSGIFNPTILDQIKNPNG